MRFTTALVAALTLASIGVQAVPTYDDKSGYKPDNKPEHGKDNEYELVCKEVAFFHDWDIYNNNVSVRPCSSPELYTTLTYIMHGLLAETCDRRKVHLRLCQGPCEEQEVSPLMGNARGYALRPSLTPILLQTEPTRLSTTKATATPSLSSMSRYEASVRCVHGLEDTDVDRQLDRLKTSSRARTGTWPSRAAATT
jgi:hypothetical protein